MIEPKRRLPVLNSVPQKTLGESAGEPEATPRPTWQWVAFGALGIVTTWIPLAAIAGAIASALSARAETAGEGRTADVAGAGAAVVASYVTVLALGALLGGFLVGRWGPPHVGVREAAIAGLCASTAAAAATWLAFGSASGVWVVVLVATPSAALGGRLGVRGRRL